MFRRLPSGLPKDASYPSDLGKLGFKVLKAKDSHQIVSIEAPHGRFRYLANDNERHNEVRREAFHECLRQEVLQSLKALDLAPIYLPQLSRASLPPPNEPTLAILATADRLSTIPLNARNRVVVIINNRTADLGVLSYRRLAGKDGIHGGSMHALVKALMSQNWRRPSTSTIAHPFDESTADEIPGIIILNAGQTYFSHTHPAHPTGTAMTAKSWLALPRPSGLHEPPKVHPEHNRIPGHESAEAHLATCFSAAVLGNPALVHPCARLLIIAGGDGADETLQVLANQTTWAAFGPRIAGLALAAPSPVARAVGVDFLTPEKHPGHSVCTVECMLQKEAFRTLLAERTKAWCLSDKALGTPLANAGQVPLNKLASASIAAAGGDVDELAALMQAVGLATDMPPPRDGEVIHADGACEGEFALWPQVSGGEAQNAEDVLVEACGDIAGWLAEVERAGDGYANPLLDIEIQAHANTESKGWADWDATGGGKDDDPQAEMLSKDAD